MSIQHRTLALASGYGSGGVLNWYVHGLGLLSEGDTVSFASKYYLEDGLGNIRFLTSDSGSKKTSTNYDPFGNVRSSSGILPPYQFQEQRLDEESNLYFLRARYYDPQLGRFISRDPIKGPLTLPQSQNPYAYALNNPVNLSDPSGEKVAGLCVNANIGIAAFGTCSLCIVGTSNKEIGFVANAGGGGTTGLATGIGGLILWSPQANSLEDMKGQDVFTGGSAWVAQGDVSWNRNNSDIKTYTVGVSIGPDFGLPFSPVEFHGGSTYNWTLPLIKF